MFFHTFHFKPLKSAVEWSEPRISKGFGFKQVFWCTLQVKDGGFSDFRGQQLCRDVLMHADDEICVLA